MLTPPPDSGSAARLEVDESERNRVNLSSGTELLQHSPSEMNAGDSPASPREAIKLVSPYCDIEERLRLLPPAARVRGVYLRSLPKVLAAKGCADRYLEYFPSERFSVIKFYPLRDYMIRLAVAGAALRGPESVHEGMHEIWKTNATTFAQSLVGRAMLRILSHDPSRLIEQALAARRQTFQYGHWEVIRHGSNSVEMVYREEYIWIESAIAGGAVGSVESCGMQVKVETNLDDRFNGSSVLTW